MSWFELLCFTIRGNMWTVRDPSVWDSSALPSYEQDPNPLGHFSRKARAV
jgi:hypothetical protein